MLTDRSPDVVRLAAWLTIAAIIVIALYVGRDILIPLTIAFLISFALSPLVRWVTRRGLPRVASVTLVLLTVITLLAGLGLVIGLQLRILSAELPTYQSTIRDKIGDLGERMKGPGIFDGAFETIGTVQRAVEQAAGDHSGPAPTRVEVVSDAASPLRTAAEWLGPALAPLATAGIVIVFVFLALLDRGDLRDRLLQMLGGNLHRSTDAMEEAGTRISKYLLMQLVVNVSYGIPMALGLWFIGVPGWILWGTLAALMRFIPYVGPMLSAIFPIALAFAVDPGWTMVLLTIGLILFLELVSNNIVEPMLYGTSTGLSAMSLITAATFWTALWGPAGLILSTPLTVCLLVIGRNLPALGFLETLLGSAPALDISTRIYQRLLANDPEEAIEIAGTAIEATSVPDFYHAHGIGVLRQASADFLEQARAEHRLRVISGMDVLLDDLREEYPGAIPADAPAPRVACIGGKREIDAVAGEMLAHALATRGIAAVERPAGILTGRYLDGLDLAGMDIVCISYFSADPANPARSFCRRLRHRWPHLRIVLALWNLPGDPDTAVGAEAFGADAIVTSINEALGRIERMLIPAALDGPVPEAPAEDLARTAAIEATAVRDGHLRAALDTLAVRAAEVFDVRFAVVSVLYREAEVVIGQNTGWPGQADAAGALPRLSSLCDPVVAADRVLVVDDTARDPQFADRAAIAHWKARFYAGAPLRTSDGLVLGALCLLDPEPRTLAETECALLADLAAEIASVVTGNDVAGETPEDIPNSATIGQPVPQ